MTAPVSPWNKPPERKKTLSRRRAEKAARKGEARGARLQAAREEGPDAVAAVTWDWVRADLNRLPDDKRKPAYEALTTALERIRDQHAQ